MPTVFEDVKSVEWAGTKATQCNDKEHFPPTHILIPQGKRMIHTCPACGHVTTVEATDVQYLAGVNSVKRYMQRQGEGK